MEVDEHSSRGLLFCRSGTTPQSPERALKIYRSPKQEVTRRTGHAAQRSRSRRRRIAVGCVARLSRPLPTASPAEPPGATVGFFVGARSWDA